jgi:hypothetical protein
MRGPPANHTQTKGRSVSTAPMVPAGSDGRANLSAALVEVVPRSRSRRSQCAPGASRILATAGPLWERPVYHRAELDPDLERALSVEAFHRMAGEQSATSSR